MSGSNYKQMVTAIHQLKKYANVTSVADFMLRAVAMGSNDDDDDLQTSGLMMPTETVFEFITNIQDGGLFTNEILKKTKDITSQSPPTEMNEAQQTQFNDTKTALANAFYVVGSKNLGNLKESGIGCDPASAACMEDVLGVVQGTAGADGDPSAPSKTIPALTTIQVLPAMLNYGSRDTGAVEVFMNMIPALEWSRAVPYVDVQVISPGSAVADDGGKKMLVGMGQLRFLNGKSEITGFGDLVIAQSMTGENFVPAPQPATDPPTAQLPAEEAPAPVNTVGMEIFTSPQTLVPSWEQYSSYDEVGEIIEDDVDINNMPYPGVPGSPRSAPVIDRMRPFMTFEGMKIKVVPTRGMMSHKSAEFSLVLHDRSRLSEIGPLVRPDQFGKTEILVTWGWSHPDSPGNNGNSNNPFGLFIDSLKTKEKFGVYNSKYSFTDDGQVNINLTCVTRGANQVNITDIGMSPEATTKIAAFEVLIQAISELRRTIVGGIPQMAEVVGFSTISNLSPTNAGVLFSGDSAVEIDAFINNNKESGGNTQALAEALDEAKGSTSQIQTTIAGVIATKVAIAGSVGDPWLKARNAPKADATPKINYSCTNSGVSFSAPDNANWCSFGRLAALFIGAPIMESKKFDEVQMIFYTFNDKASYMWDQNIACFPVDLDGNTGFPKLFEEWQAEKIQVSIGSFMGFMNRYYLSNMAAKAYGFNTLFSRDEDGKAVIAADQDVTQLQSEKDKVLSLAYGPDSVTSFKLPRIRMVPECVPHQKAGEAADEFGEKDTILRLHFFDDSACKYSSLHDILASTRESSMGSLKTAANSVTNAEGSTDSNWDEISSAMIGNAPAALLDKMPGSETHYYVKGGAPALKYYIKNNMPSITFGSQNCSMTQINMASMHNSGDTTIHMLRAQRAGNSDQGTPGAQDRGLPIRLMPMQAGGTSMGCPILNHGQQFFIDMGTGTTADNIYAICGLDHDISPGSFMTKFKLIPIDAYGKYESMLTSVDSAMAAIDAAEAQGTTTPAETSE